MTIIPIKDTKNTAKMSDLCQQTDEPIYITKNGYGHMVMMGYDAFGAYIERQRKEAVAEAQEEWEQQLIAENVRAGFAEIDRGEGQDAYEALAEIRTKYGI